MSSANTVEFGQNLGNVGIDDLARQTLGDRRLADAGIADQEGIVLLPAAQHLDGALDLGLAADEGIDAPLTRLPVEVDAICFQSAFLFLGIRRRPSNSLESRDSCSSSAPRGRREGSEAPGRLAIP